MGESGLRPEQRIQKTKPKDDVENRLGWRGEAYIPVVFLEMGSRHTVVLKNLGCLPSLALSSW